MIFFNAGDPYFGEVKISARGNLSIEEINKLTSDVEDIISTILFGSRVKKFG